MAEPRDAKSTTSGTRVLYIEDDASDEFLVRHALQKDFPGLFSLIHARNETDALLALGAQSFDVCLLDLSLPDSCGFSTLQHLLQRTPDLPVLILTGNGSESLGRAAVAAGAQDYLLKDKAQGVALRQAIEYAIARRQRQDDLIKRAHYDDLTGMLRADYFRPCLETAMIRAQRTRRGVALYFIDLDRFKEINDTHGHEVGDAVLKIAAGRLKECLRAYDVAARYGGDEFVVLVEDLASVEDSTFMAERLLESVKEPVTIGQASIQIQLSIGIATAFAGDQTHPDLLIKQADMAMYQAKAETGSCYRIYSGSLQEKARRQRQLVHELRDAITQNQLQIYYQPRITTESGKIGGAEALLRWQHPMQGLLAPDIFMEAAAENGLMEELELWSLQRICEDIKTWHEKGVSGMSVAVNMSWKRLESAHFTGQMKEILSASRLPAGSLIAEISEESLTHANGSLMARMRDLCDMGLLLRIDHFGKGQGSVLLLQQMPLTHINIDRGLLDNMKNSASSKSLVRAMIDMAHGLNLKTTAVGIETCDQRDTLLQYRCDELQGYYFCPPVQAHLFEKALTLSRAA